MHTDIRMTETDTFGGSCETPCFALLDGRVTDPDTEETSTFRIPLTKLPAVLGRSHDTTNPNFFGLGRRKALSRKQCVIYYQVAKGGSVEWEGRDLQYKQSGSWDYKKTTMKTPADKLPKEGFFVIECLGRNSITVNKQKLEQGESIVLESGSPIRVSQHRLYFLLPTDSPPRKQLIETSSSSAPPKTAVPKRRMSLDSSSSSPTKKVKGLQSYTESLETMSTEELLRVMTNAITANVWDRKNQMVGTVLVLRAVKDAALAHEIMELAKDNGVARNRVIDWIEKSARYKQFVQQLNSKIEPRSYQAAMTKALLKAGYARNGTAGRYVKWHLPPTDGDAAGEGPAEDNEAENDDDDNQEEEEDANDENEEDDDEEKEHDDNDVEMEETENNEDDEDEQEEEEDDDGEGEEVDDDIDNGELDEEPTERADDDDLQEENSETNRDESVDVNEEGLSAENEDRAEMKEDEEDEDDDDENDAEEEVVETKEASAEHKSEPEQSDTKEEDKDKE